MKKLLLTFTLFILTGCGDFGLPLLPENDNEAEYVDSEWFDLEVSPDEDQTDSSISLIVATVGGYDVPFSGKVYLSKQEEIQALETIIPDARLGSLTGADIAVSTWENGFFVIGRYDSSSVYFFTAKSDGNNFEFSEVNVLPQKALNLQDGVYNHLKSEFIISALNSNSLIILKDGEISELKISANANASPAKMKIIGDRLFVAMQNLNDQWQSQDGEIAVIDLNDHNVKVIDLPVKNPVGKIEYNQEVDPDHFYISCAGSWQKRDGALLRVNINTHKSQIILKESSKEGSLLDGDVVDVSIADNGNFYLIFSSNSGRWINKLLKYDPAEGVISEIDSGVNAFAANPVDFSTVTKKIYYFTDSGPDTFLRSIDTITGDNDEIKLDDAPASVTMWKRDKNND